MSSLRFGIIGAGGIAASYATAFAASRSAELVAVTDTQLSAAKALAEPFGCQVFDNHQKMCEQTQLDAVVVCTPPTTHPEITTELMQLGIHVLCEKPLAISSVDAKRMIAEAENNNVIFTMASKFRYVDDLRKIKSIVDAGTLGEIVLVENVFTSPVDMSKRWNSDPAISGGGVLIDNGTHSVDIMRNLMGPLADLQVVEGIRVQDIPVEDTVRIFVRAESGAMGSIDLSWSLKKEQPFFVSIYGSKGTALIGWAESKYKLNTEDDWTAIGSGYDKVQAFVNQIENFAGAIKGEENLLITSEDALASVEVIETAYASLRNLRWQTVGVNDILDKITDDNSLETHGVT